MLKITYETIFENDEDEYKLITLAFNENKTPSVKIVFKFPHYYIKKSNNKNILLLVQGENGPRNGIVLYKKGDYLKIKSYADFGEVYNYVPYDEEIVNQLSALNKQFNI